MLLKSWAIPPARVPMDSIFCDRRNCRRNWSLSFSVSFQFLISIKLSSSSSLFPRRTFFAVFKIGIFLPWISIRIFSELSTSWPWSMIGHVQLPAGHRNSWHCLPTIRPLSAPMASAAELLISMIVRVDGSMRIIPALMESRRKRNSRSASPSFPENTPERSLDLVSGPQYPAAPRMPLKASAIAENKPANVPDFSSTRSSVAHRSDNASRVLPPERSVLKTIRTLRFFKSCRIWSIRPKIAPFSCIAESRNTKAMSGCFLNASRPWIALRAVRISNGLPSNEKPCIAFGVKPRVPFPASNTRTFQLSVPTLASSCRLSPKKNSSAIIFPPNVDKAPMSACPSNRTQNFPSQPRKSPVV